MTMKKYKIQLRLVGKCRDGARHKLREGSLQEGEMTSEHAEHNTSLI